MGYTLIVRLPKLQGWKRLIYDFNFVSNPPPDEPANPQKPKFKWRKPALNDKFDVVISYEFKIKIWSKIFSIIKEIIHQFM
jgi:hypothetical protein